MLLRNYNVVAIAVIIFLPVLIISCKKSDRYINPEDPPGEAIPPVSMTYTVTDYEHLNFSFKYDEFPDKVSVYYDDTLTEDKYDHIFAEYIFNKDGYLTGNTFYNLSGDVKSNLSIERDNNVVKYILVKRYESGVGKTDTFHVSFTDSTGAPDYTFMNVNYGKYFYDIPVSMRFAYCKDNIIKTTAGLYTSPEGNAILFPSLMYIYNGFNQLERREADLYYGTDFFYEEGKGLDSLFKVLGGKDWPYLENILNYDENTSIFFYPLYITLSKGNVDIDIYMHRYGTLSEIRSIPNGVEYPATEIFSFSNSFDNSKKLLQSTIFNNGREYASYQFGY